MRAGQRDRLITLQRKTAVVTESGEHIAVWQTLTRIWSSMRPVRGDERFIDPQINAYEQVEFRVPYAAAVADLSPQDRVVYPGLDDTSPEPEPADRSIHDILAVHEIGRREGLQIIAARRSDV